MSCILRVSGKRFDVDKFLEDFPVETVNIWRAGQPRFKRDPEGRKNETSGLGIELSEADFSDLLTQINDAIEFCKEYRELLITLTRYPGVDDVIADFGAEVREPFWHSYSFPAELLKEFGEIGISLGLSVYPVYDEDDQEDDEAEDKSN